MNYSGTDIEEITDIYNEAIIFVPRDAFHDFDYRGIVR
jgi:hypothetical protein